MTYVEEDLYKIYMALYSAKNYTLSTEDLVRITGLDQAKITAICYSNSGPLIKINDQSGKLKFEINKLSKYFVENKLTDLFK